MISKKNRRASGRRYNKNYDPENGAYNEKIWDDWKDRRDGMRDTSDKTLKKPKHLHTESWCWLRGVFAKAGKIKKLLLRRKKSIFKQKLKERDVHV